MNFSQALKTHVILEIGAQFIGEYMSASAQRKHRDKGERSTRDLLLDTVAELMSERGEANITLSELGERSGSNTALVRYYFGNKAGMMYALVERTLEDSVVQMDKLLKTDIPPDEKLFLHIKGLISNYFDHPYVNRLIHHLLAVNNGEYIERLKSQFMQPIYNCQATILSEGEKTGVFQKIDPKLLNLHINGACDFPFHNIAYLESLHGISAISEELKDNYIEHVTSVIIQGIRETDK